MLTEVQKKNKVYSYLLFLVSPIFALYLSCKDYRGVSSKNIVWVFSVFYGYTLVISNPDLDVNRLKEFFLIYAQFENFSPTEFASTLYAEDSWNTDILSEFLRWFVSRFTDNFHFYFAVLGLVYGYFYSRNIWYLIDNTEGRINRNALLFIVVFSLLVPFWGVNIFRFFTATHIFFFGCIRYFLQGKKRYIFVALLSGLVHFSFILPSLLLVLNKLIGNKPKILLTFFVVSFFIPELNSEFFREIEFSFFPTVYEKKIGSYTGESYVRVIDGIKSLEKNWYVVGRILLMKAIVLISLSMCVKNLDEIKNLKLMPLYCFSLLIVGVSNIISNIPSLDRFLSVSNLFVFAFLFLFFQKMGNVKWLHKIKPLFIVGVVLFAVVEIRIGMDTIGFRALSNPLVAFFIEEDLALIDVLK